MQLLFSSSATVYVWPKEDPWTEDFHDEPLGMNKGSTCQLIPIFCYPVNDWLMIDFPQLVTEDVEESLSD
jgi:hypothetical protein